MAGLWGMAGPVEAGKPAGCSYSNAGTEIMMLLPVKSGDREDADGFFLIAMAQCVWGGGMRRTLSSDRECRKVGGNAIAY